MHTGGREVTNRLHLKQMTKLIPSADRVIVKLEEYKDSELIIHAGTHAFQAPNIGIIRFLGVRAKEAGLNVGDKVYCEQYKGRELKDINGEALKFLKLEDVLGIVESIEI